MRSIVVAAALLLAASPALAQKRSAAPAPAKAVPEAVYSGRWFEIARTPNGRQKDCQAPTVDFTLVEGRRHFALTCRMGSPSGEAGVRRGRMALVGDAQNAKFKATFVGFISQEYWILDRAEDSSWALLATPGGNYVWVLSRTAVPSAGTRNAAMARAKALGYANLETPKQPPA